MKILQVIASLNPQHGGPIEAAKQINKILSESGMNVDIACLDKRNDKWIKKPTLKIYTLGPGFGVFKYSLKYSRWLDKNIKKYDLALIHGIWRHNSFGLWKAAKKYGVPYFIFTHGMLDPWFKKKYPLKHLKKWFYWPWGEYRVLRDAQNVFFTSEDERKLARKSFWLYKCKEKVVNYGIQSPKLDKPKQTKAFFDSFPYLRKKKIILFLGRIHKKKGCDLLIKSFSKIAAKDSKLHLVIAGPDQEGLRVKLEKISKKLSVHKKITWAGMLKGMKKWGAFQAAEAFILPSHQENFGIAVVEALACGTPVLISDKVNIWREIKIMHAGIVGTDDIKGTTKILNEWVNKNPKQRDAMKKKAQECFQKNFEISRLKENLVEILSSVKK